MPQTQTAKKSAPTMVQLINKSRYTLGLTSNPLNASDPAGGPKITATLDPTSSKDIPADEWKALKAHGGTAKFLGKGWIIAIPRTAPGAKKEKFDITSYGDVDAIETIQMERNIESLQLMLANEEDLTGDKHKDREGIRKAIHTQLSAVAER